MNRVEKQTVIDNLKEKFSSGSHFYVTDASSLTVMQVNELRADCYKNGVEFKVAKNTLIKKALDACDQEYDKGLYDILVGPTSLMFCETANAPAKVLKDFRKTYDKPILKGAHIDLDLYIGDNQIEILSSLKSKEELIGEIISLLQSPIKNVMASLNSGSQKLTGILKTLANREQQ